MASKIKSVALIIVMSAISCTNRPNRYSEKRETTDLSTKSNNSQSSLGRTTNAIELCNEIFINKRSRDSLFSASKGFLDSLMIKYYDQYNKVTDKKVIFDLLSEIKQNFCKSKNKNLYGYAFWQLAKNESQDGYIAEALSSSCNSIFKGCTADFYSLISCIQQHDKDGFFAIANLLSFELTNEMDSSALKNLFKQHKTLYPNRSLVIDSIYSIVSHY
jgi:hypothetical protein